MAFGHTLNSRKSIKNTMKLRYITNPSFRHKRVEKKGRPLNLQKKRSSEDNGTGIKGTAYNRSKLHLKIILMTG